ncbi:putative inner membrane protein [Escherichia coli]|uniref:Putative inner membrane protein n=1 Tax=Escherichia coli TaxID=562 RepID=A0A377B6S7_ECOLX|nr:putative inner membrane protein [Escherichia coli]
MKKVTFPRLSGWLVASVALFVVIGWTSSAQIPVVIYKLSLVSLSACWDTGSIAVCSPGHGLTLLAPGRNRVAAPAAMIRRAIIVAAVCLSVALGYSDVAEIYRVYDYFRSFPA